MAVVLRFLSIALIGSILGYTQGAEVDEHKEQIETFDANMDGFLDLDEVLAGIKREETKGLSEEEQRENQEELDRSLEEVKKVFPKADLNGDGKLSLGEFQKAADIEAEEL